MTATVRPVAAVEAESSHADAVPRLHAFTKAVLAAGVTIAYVGVIILRPSLPNNLAFVDGVLLLLGVAGLVSMSRVGSPATLTAARLLPWFWVFVVASMAGLATVGFTFWAGASLLSTTVALLSFFCLWHLMDIYRLEKAARVGLVIATVLAMFALFTDPRAYRPEGWFAHANYAGHFGVAAGFILILAYRQWWLRALGLVSIAFTIQATGSFGALGMMLAMGAVVGWRSLQRNTAVLLVALVGLVIAAGLVLAAPEPDLPTGAGTAARQSADASPLNEARFARSSQTRVDIWSQALAVWWDNPFGIGPNGVKNRDAAEQRGRAIEVHSDPIGVLVDRGPLGVIGFIGMWTVIWAATTPFGLARILIIGNWVQGLFRETLHYRHMWVLLALLMVLDARATAREPTPPTRAAVPTH